MRRVGVIGPVAVLVVPAVQRDPLEQRPLDRHGAQDREDELDERDGLEGAVREEAVVADRDPQDREAIQPEQEAQLDPAEAPAPQGSRGGDSPSSGTRTARELATRTPSEMGAEGSPGNSASGSATGSGVNSGVVSVMVENLARSQS